MIDLTKISGIGEWSKKKHGENGEDWVYEVKVDGVDEGKAFLVVRPKTVEMRCDAKLGAMLREKYESVMESRYFGKGGIEVVPSGQLEEGELEDLVRLSYNLTKQKLEMMKNE